MMLVSVMADESSSKNPAKADAACKIKMLYLRSIHLNN
jgi:hypothetical protein